MSDEKKIFAALDIGGTKIAAALVDDAGTILTQTRTPMVSDSGEERAFAAVRESIDTLFAANPDVEPSAIGISAPGPLDPRTGVILNPPNVPCWRNFPLQQRVAESYSLPTFIENDANGAALAEQRWGAAKGKRIVFYATLGTGIGSGLIIDGKIYNGSMGTAPEAGHITIDYRGPKCGCGKRGCVEGLTSGPAIAARARTILTGTKVASPLLTLAGGDPARITAEHVAQAWREGDPIATEALRETALMWTVWFGCIIDVLEPEIIVFGGGLSDIASGWLDKICSEVPQWALNQRAAEIPIVRGHYGVDAGLAGAAALCTSSS